MSSTILELRQRDAPESLDTPGDWETIITKPILIEEGDQIAMKACFLDSQAQSEDRIVIQNPIKVSISNGFYINMVRGDGQENSIIDHTAYVADTQKGFTDGKPYVLCSVQDTDPGAYYFPGCSLQTSGGAAGFPKSSSENNVTLQVQFMKPGATTPSTYTYTLDDPNTYAPGIGAPGTSTTVNIPSTNDFWHAVIYDPATNIPGKDKPMVFTGGSIYKPTSPPSGSADTKVEITNDGNTIKLEQIITNRSNPDGDKLQWEFDLFDVKNPADAAGDNNVVPYIKSDPNLNSFIVPAGSYDPTQLCTIVNRQLQLNTVVPFADYNLSYVNSNFLVAYNPDYPEFSGNNLETKFIAQDLSNATQYTNASLGPANGAILVGATQMVLDYDQEAKQFMWSYIHMPFDGGKDQSGLVESAGILNSDNLVNDNGKPFAVSRNGGIFFTDFIQKEFIGNDVVITKQGNGRLDITGGTPRDFNFLSSACGFDLDDLKTAIKPIANPPSFGTFNIDKLNMPVDLTTGIKTTSGYFGLDAIVDRAANGNQWWHPPTAGDAGFFSNITGMTIPVYNDEKSGGKDDHLTFGYYLIDVNAKFNNEFTGGNYQSNNIRAIVSRYYQQNSYTIGSAADSVPYIHKGDPVLLSSFKCRVLSGDKTLAPDLEADNTIHMEVIKAPKEEMPQK